MELKLTPAAEKFISRMVRFGGAGENAGFRLTVSAGGCSGLASEFSVEAAALPLPAQFANNFGVGGNVVVAGDYAYAAVSDVEDGAGGVVVFRIVSP